MSYVDRATKRMEEITNFVAKKDVEYQKETSRNKAQIVAAEKLED